MKIKIHDKARKSLTDNEYKYLLLLEIHKQFWKEVGVIRKKLGINIGEENTDEIFLNNEVANLVNNFNIPFPLFSQIRDLVDRGEILSQTPLIGVMGIAAQERRKSLYGKYLKLPSLKHGEILRTENWYESNKKTLLKSKSIIPALPLIQINKPLTKALLKKSIDDNWEAIQVAQQDYDKSLPFPSLKHISEKDIRGFIKIFRLRLKGKSYSIISSVMNIEEDTARSMYSDFTKLLRNLNF